MVEPPRSTGTPGFDISAVLSLTERFQLALQRRERASIVDILRQLVALRPPMGSDWEALAHIAAENGELTLGREAIDLFVETAPDNPQVRYRKVGFLFANGAFEAAREIMRTLPADVPDAFNHALSHGGIGIALGETEEARMWLTRAIDMRPQSGSAWHLIAKVVDFAAQPELFGRIAAAERTLDAPTVRESALFFYALGKALADIGDHPRAVAAFARGAREMKPDARYDRDWDRNNAIDAVREYDSGRIAASAEQQSEPTARSIFVMGLPRSGTTLIQQILTSHSVVAGGGEINRLSLLAQDLGGASYPVLANRTDPPALARLWDHWLDESFGRRGRVVDKTNHNTRMLGLAASLLPEAPLVWLTRDPLDCAWSCFRTWFLGSVAWSYDLKDIAFHFRLEDELLARWRDMLGDRLLVLRYETLATEPEAEIRRLLAHCGLTEEPQAFAPHENRKAVTTASTMQVRRPINREGIGAAEPYREFLAPFIEAYGK